MSKTLKLRAVAILAFLDERRVPDEATCEINWSEGRGSYSRIYPLSVKELRELCKLARNTKEQR